MSKIEAQEIYCPECDTDYTVAWEDNEEQMFVLCDCNEAEAIQEFHERFTDEFAADDTPRGYR